MIVEIEGVSYVLEENEHLTPVYPYEYDHLRLYMESDREVTESSEDTLEEHLFNHETYQYF